MKESSERIELAIWKEIAGRYMSVSHDRWHLDHGKLLLFLALRSRRFRSLRFGCLDNTMFGVNVSWSFAAQRLDAQGVERPDQVVDAGIRVEVITGAPTPPEPPTHPFQGPLAS